MKVALYTIAAMIAAYVIFIQQPNARKQEYEERRLEETKRERDELDRESARAIAELTASAKRREEKAKEAARKAEFDALREAAMKSAAVPVASESKETASAETPPDHGTFGQYADRVFIVKGDAGDGSGFICEINGQPVAVTNTHVLSGNKSLTFARADGKVLAVAADQLSVALDRDLAFFPLKEKQPALQLAPPTTEIKIGDDVACFGNSHGQSVITDIKGTILGLGPKEIEVDADVVQGNSGCPVIHIASGKVIGVVTRGHKEALSSTNSGTRFAEERRFCLRIEGADWQRIGWASFASQASLIESYRQNRQNLEALIVDLSAGNLNPAGYATSSQRLQSAVRAFMAADTSASISDTASARLSLPFCGNSRLK